MLGGFSSCLEHGWNAARRRISGVEGGREGGREGGTRAKCMGFN